jgi:hypothetical protein
VDGAAVSFWEAVEEFGLESQMETAPSKLQSELPGLVQEVNESDPDQSGDGSAYLPEILAEITERVRRMSMPVPEDPGLDDKGHIRVVINSLKKISRSWIRRLEKDLEVIFRDCFLVHAIARDPHAARQIHEATGVPMRTLCKWRDHLAVDASWRPWNQTVNPSLHNRKLTDHEENQSGEARMARCARGESIDRKLAQIVIRQITLETRGVWVSMCLSSVSGLMHPVGFTPRGAHIRHRQEADLRAEGA